MAGSAPRPGEAAFRAGWTSLRAGRAEEAAASFATACTAAGGDALGEDACFWAGAAAKRAGNTSEAKAQLVAFLRRFPSSARAAEAAALLGWTLYDAGDVDGAEPYFRRAADDKVPSIRDSARRGLEAIQRLRVR
jgi:TolA-binding protein